MKARDIEEIQKFLSEIKDFSNKQDYNTFTFINQRIVKILPILDTELKRLELTNVEMNCPKIKIFTNRNAKESKQTVEEYMNERLKELVLDDYKIIDYGKLDETFEDDNTRTIYFYIKYTS